MLYLREKLSKLARLVNPLRRGEDGAVSAEYVAILVVVAGLIAVVIGLQLSQTVKKCGEEAKKNLFVANAPEVDCSTGGGEAGGGGE